MKHDFIDRYSGIDSPLHRLDARAKILSFFSLIIICVSTPPDAYLSFLGYFVFLLGAIAVSSVPWRYVLLRSLVIIPFVVLVAMFLPFLNTGTQSGGYSLGIGALQVSKSGLLIFWNVLIKSFLAILAIILLSSTTPFPKLLQGLEQLRVPRVFIMLASFAYRYIFVLADEAMRMKTARDSRGYGGRWLWQSKVIGHMIGSLFLRSYERGERVYMAMVSRGFEGKATSLGGTRLRRTDYLFVTTTLALLLALRTVIM